MNNDSTDQREFAGSSQEDGPAGGHDGRRKRIRKTPGRYNEFLFGNDYPLTGSTDEDQMSRHQPGGPLTKDLQDIAAAMAAFPPDNSEAINGSTNGEDEKRDDNGRVSVTHSESCRDSQVVQQGPTASVGGTGTGLRIVGETRVSPAIRGLDWQPPMDAAGSLAPLHGAQIQGYGYGGGREEGYGYYGEGYGYYDRRGCNRDHDIVPAASKRGRMSDQRMEDQDRRGDTSRMVLESLRDVRNEMSFRFDALDRRIDALENLLRQTHSNEFPRKPDCLPLRTREDIVIFETIPKDEFNNVVTFLGSLSCGSTQERANIIMKAAIADMLAPSLTIQGGDPKTYKLEGTRFSEALYAAVAKDQPPNEKPSRRTFVEAMTAALKAAKQRYRRLREKEGPPRQQQHPPRDPEGNPE